MRNRIKSRKRAAPYLILILILMLLTQNASAALTPHPITYSCFSTSTCTNTYTVPGTGNYVVIGVDSSGNGASIGVSFPSGCTTQQSITQFQGSYAASAYIATCPSQSSGTTYTISTNPISGTAAEISETIWIFQSGSYTSISNKNSGTSTTSVLQSLAPGEQVYLCDGASASQPSFGISGTVDNLGSYTGASHYYGTTCTVTTTSSDGLVLTDLALMSSSTTTSTTSGTTTSTTSSTSTSTTTTSTSTTTIPATSNYTINFFIEPNVKIITSYYNCWPGPSLLNAELSDIGYLLIPGAGIYQAIASLASGAGLGNFWLPAVCTQSNALKVFFTLLNAYGIIGIIAYLIPLINLLIVITAIVGLSGLLGGDTELAGLTRLI